MGRLRPGIRILGPAVHVGAIMLVAVEALVGHPGTTTALYLGIVATVLLIYPRYLAVERGPRWGYWLIPLDATFMVLLLMGTGGVNSQLLPVGLAGIAWGGLVLPGRGARYYAAVFTAGYLLLVMPDAVSHEMVPAALAILVASLALASVLDWRLAIDPRALRISEALGASEESAARERHERLAAALGSTVVPVDGLIAASHIGFTVEETELLGYLLLGLTNQQIGEAISLSPATVKYRLTRLYRKLGVRGRGEAVAYARSIGLGRAAEAGASSDGRDRGRQVPAPSPAAGEGGASSAD